MMRIPASRTRRVGFMDGEIIATEIYSDEAHGSSFGRMFQGKNSGMASSKCRGQMIDTVAFG